MATKYGATDKVRVVVALRPAPEQQPPPPADDPRVVQPTPTLVEEPKPTHEPQPRTETARLVPSGCSGGGPARYIRVEGGHARLRDVGRVVSVPSNMYLKTNFYIRQSRQYFKEHKLHCFVYFRGMLWSYILVALCSLLAPTSSTYAFICLVANVVFTVLWSQHFYVVLTTLPLVLSQKVLLEEGAGTTNKHLEISIEQHRTDILEKDGEMVGILGRKRGSGKFQAFTASAIQMIKGCRIASTVCLVVSLCFLVYCTASGVLRAIHGQA